MAGEKAPSETGERKKRQTGGLIDPIFVSQEMSDLFSDTSLLQAMLDVEAALAQAEAKHDIIPYEHANLISKACDARLYDIDKIGHHAALAGNPVIPLVKALTAQCGNDTGRYVHWGATSQDVLDTGMMRLADAGLKQIACELSDAIAASIVLVEAHGESLMAGRTLMQQALPIRFGAKGAVWLSGLTAARQTVRRLVKNDLAVQLAGAAGTLAAFGGKGEELRATLAQELKLSDPGGPWHVERTRIADIACGLGLVSGALSKIATDIMLLMQTEVGEAMEPAAPGRGGSSTMPHKRNPAATAAVRANHRRIVGLVSTMLMAMESEHERGAGGWAAEWETFRDLFRLSGGSAAIMSQVLAGLEVDRAAMAANLRRTRGLVMAESLMMALAERTGKAVAHHLVDAASRRAINENRDLAAIAGEEPEIARHLSGPEIRAVLSPGSGLDTSAGSVRRAVAAARAELEEELT